MFRQKLTIILSLMLFLTVWNVVWPAAKTEAETDADEMLLEVDRNMQPPSFEMYRKLINVEPNGERKEYVFYTVRKDDNMAAVFLDPPSEKGRSTLRRGNNMWLYIPEVGRPIRITSLQSAVGGVFNNSDIMRLDFSDEYTAEFIGEDEGSHILLLTARDHTVAYGLLKMRVDKEAKIPTRIEAYADEGLLIKVLEYSGIKNFGGGIVRPSRLDTTSPLQEGYRSVMLFSNIRARELADEVFTISYMPRVGELR
ncbi:MAG: outer membrane lipoprotein-sorting protein [Thermodesulfobacteriota bacterium]